MNKRGGILLEAYALINGERLNDYGQPEDCFGLIAKYWSNYLQTPITPKNVALMMILLKVARESQTAKRDNILDICGYAGLAADLQAISPR